MPSAERASAAGDAAAGPGAGRRGSVVVTGASTGIGRATVKALVGGGFHVYATVRRGDDAASLGADFGMAVTPLTVDLLDESSVRAAGAAVCAAGPLVGLVNNAGAALPGPLEHLPIEVFRRQLELNLTAQLLVTQVMMPALRRSAEQGGDARIVFVGSIAGRIAGPVLGAYHSAKHGVVGLAGTLRAELAPFGIQVILVEPGAIATPIWVRALASGEELEASNPEGFARYASQLRGARTRARRGAATGLDPSVPARVVLDSLTRARPRPRRTVGRDAATVAVLVRLLPFRLVYRISRGRA